MEVPIAEDVVVDDTPVDSETIASMITMALIEKQKQQLNKANYAFNMLHGCLLSCKKSIIKYANNIYGIACGSIYTSSCFTRIRYTTKHIHYKPTTLPY